MTILNTAQLKGYGLHTGSLVEVTLHPAPEGYGIRFRRTDLGVEIPALATAVGETSRSTALAKGDAVVCTVEHLLSALNGLRIDNLQVDIDGPEVPILDGSALPWVKALLQAGLQSQQAPRKSVVLSQPLEMTEGTSCYRYEPADDFSVRCIIDFPGQAIGHQEYTFIEGDDYVGQVAPCRTFVFLHEIEPLLANNLIKGGSLNNALVFVNQPLEPQQAEHLGRVYGKDPASFEVKNGVLNTEQPLFANEPARHKTLDFLGDIMLVGAPLKGHFTIQCPGHKNNVAFAKMIMNII